MSNKPSSFICKVQLDFIITIYDEYDIINFLVYIANENLCLFSHCVPFININTSAPTNIREIQPAATLRCKLRDQYTLAVRTRNFSFNFFIPAVAIIILILMPHFIQMTISSLCSYCFESIYYIDAWMEGLSRHWTIRKYRRIFTMIFFYFCRLAEDDCLLMPNCYCFLFFTERNDSQ